MPQHRRKHHSNSSKSRKRRSDIDAIISYVVQEIWNEFDGDMSGSLDKEETRLFINHTLGNDDGSLLSDAAFEACFNEFDCDGSGTIEKAELREFIKSITGLV